MLLWGQTDLPGNGQVAALLDPVRNLEEARKSLASGNSGAALGPLGVALELARVDSPTWAAAMLLAFKEQPSLAMAMLSRGQDAEVPLTLMPEPVETPAGSPFTPPASYVKLEFLPPNKRRLVDHLQKVGQEAEATRVLEQTIEEEGAKPALLLYLATLYERMGELPLAMQRYKEAHDLISLDEDRFAALYSMMRVLYRQQRMIEAEAVLKTYTALARAQVTQFVDRIRSSPGSRAELLGQLLASRRHLVEVLNLQGVLKLRKSEERNAQFLFGQAQLLAPGRLSVALNYNHCLELGGHYETATGNLVRIRQVLTAVSAELQRLIDQTMGGGLGGAADSYKRGQALLQTWLGTVASRQGILLYHLRKLDAAARVLAEASGYAADEPLPYYILGMLQFEQNRLPEAQVSFSKALTHAGDREELAQLAKAKVDKIMEAQTDQLLAARSPEDRARELAGSELDAKKLKPLEEGLQLGLKLYRERRYAEAAPLFEKLGEEFPHSADPPYYLGLIRQQVCDSEGARKHFQRSLEIVPDYVPALSQLAFVMADEGYDARDSLKLAERASVLAPADPGVLANLGWVRFYAGDSRGAIGSLKQAIDLSPKVPDYHMRLGLVFYRASLHQLALSKFQDVLGLEPANSRASLFAGLSMARLGRAREALAVLAQSLPKFPPPGEMNKVLVSTMASLRAGLMARGEDASAGTTAPLGMSAKVASPVTHRVIAPALTPEEARRNATAAGEVGAALDLVKAGRRDEARGRLEAAVKEFPGDAVVAFPLAILNLEDGDLDRARALLDSILDVNPLDLAAGHSIGDVYFRQGRLVEYKDVLDRTAALAPGLQFDPFLDALAARWQQLLASGAPEPMAYERLGLLRFHQCRFKEAEEALTKAPGGPLTSLLLAQLRLHEYHRTRNEIQFQTARDLLTKSGYAFMDQLDRLWTLIRTPRLAEVTRSVEKELARHKKAELSAKEYSKTAIELASRPPIDEMDVADSPLFNRRWSQIDNKIDRTRVARTTYRERQQPVLEEIELDPGRRFRQPGGSGRKAGPLPRKAMGAAAELPLEPPEGGIAPASGAPATPSATGPASVPASAPATAPVSGPADLVVPAMSSLPARPGLAERKLAMGVELVTQGRLLEAKGEFATAIAFDDRLERAHAALALTHLGLDELAPARQVLERAARLFKPERIRNHALAWVDLLSGDAGRALALWSPAPSLEDFAFLEENVRIWNRVLTDSPGDADAVYNLALLAYLKGELGASLERLGTLRQRTGRAGTLMAAVTLCQALETNDRAAFQRGIDILRVAPLGPDSRAIATLEAFERTHPW